MKKIKLVRAVSDRLRRAFERELNPDQLAAATAPDGYNLILAGPGSGKTRVITYRVAYLIATGILAESILLATFTRRAAREMIDRLEHLVGPSAARVWAGTYHHLGNRILRRSAKTLGFEPNFSILDGEDQRDLIRLAMADTKAFETGTMAPQPAFVQAVLSYAFNVSKPLPEVIAARWPSLRPWQSAIAATSQAYAKRKQSTNSLDYDDLLGQWARLLAEFPDQLEAQGRQFRHILVDEMQDTNRIQAQIVESIARAGAGNLTAVGDDAQSIYRFRGADDANILEFPQRNPGARVYRLDTNYRSTPQIVAFTSDSIRHNARGFPKSLVSARSNGPLPLVVSTADAVEEAALIASQVLEARDQGVALKDMAVLYRNHYDSVLLQGELVERGIPYAIRSGLRLFEQAHVKDVVAHLRIFANPRDEPAWRRLLLLLPGIGQVRAGQIWDRIAGAADPLAALHTRETMAVVPPKARGPYAAFVADLDRVQAANPAQHPAQAIEAILAGGYRESVKSRYDNADNRLADLEQLAVLAGRYDDLEKLLADVSLAFEVYGQDSLAADTDPDERLILSTIHQAKGLEWSRVFVLRLNEETFPSARSLEEEGGEDEERRVFYVAITRARDELTLTYPLLQPRPGRSGSLLMRPSRFLSELEPSLYEQAEVESENDLAWSPGPRTPDPAL
jgi:DNA helicase-2/ATP-dependent DNA helicase PcrA